MISQLPASLCPVLDFSLCLKQECPAVAAMPMLVQRGRGWGSEGEQGGCKERQVLHPAAVPVL